MYNAIDVYIYFQTNWMSEQPKLIKMFFVRVIPWLLPLMSTCAAECLLRVSMYSILNPEPTVAGSDWKTR